MRKYVFLACIGLSTSVFAQRVITKPNGYKYFDVEGASSIYDTLSTEAKIMGLSVFWKEAAYNFVFFDRLKVNWDSTYYAFIPKVIAARNVYEYWRVLDDFAKVLNDGHTGIYNQDYFWRDLGRAPVNFKAVNNRRFVTRIDERLLDEIPIGTEIIAVDGQSFEGYDPRNLTGIKGTEVTYTFRSTDGREFSKKLTRVAGNDWSVNYFPKRSPIQPDFESKVLDNGVYYVKINTFADDTIPVQFRNEISKINKSKALIVDVRENDGGNTAYAVGVARHLTDKKTMIGSAWKTRLHKGANKAWGSMPDDNAWTKQNFNYLAGNEWEYHPGQEIKIDKSVEKVKVPIVVLIGERTFSAAEDFLILLDGSRNITLVGQHTAGSSGQPLLIDLPPGFLARICAKRDTYPDGRDFIGVGVKPDIEVWQTVQDYLNGVDTELSEALKILFEK